MSTVECIFWISAAILAYTYFGYPLLLVAMNLFVRRQSPGLPTVLPTVAFIITAYNEERVIAAKIHNTLALKYPSDRLTIIVITDGSDDRTPQIVEGFESVELYHKEQRSGKANAINRVVPLLNQDILVLSDANCMVNDSALMNIVRHYSDPEVGGVAGEKKVKATGSDDMIGRSEGLYWRYESFLKRLDSNLNSTMGAAGELFSLRSSLFEAIPDSTILEDFVQSLKICVKGYKLRYEPEAVAIEYASVDVGDEFERKSRISAGGFQAMGLVSQLFNIARYPVTGFQFISHRVLRWTLAPLSLIVVSATGIILYALSATPLHAVMFFGVLTFYGLVAIGWLGAQMHKHIPVASTAWYFLVMNAAVFAGFLRYMRGSQQIAWKKAERPAADKEVSDFQR
jgi:biofilm PGA synthesis N-glycosyltransferase PgaC